MAADRSEAAGARASLPEGAAELPPTTAVHAASAGADLAAKARIDRAALVRAAQAFAAAGTAASTRLAYGRDWRAFVAWCEQLDASPLPASGDTVALYLSAGAQAGLRPASLERRLAAIARAHRAAGQPSPRPTEAVRVVLRGIRRILGTAPKQKAPILLDELRAMARACVGTRLIDLRNRALLLVGFATALRRSELVALNVEDLVLVEQGLRVTVGRDKVDQEGRGRLVGVPRGEHADTCPVRAFARWLEAARLTTGPAFVSVDRLGRCGITRLSASDVARVVQGLADAAGLDAGRFGGHSLRAGFITVAIRAGKPEWAVMRHTGHRSLAVMRRYVREAQLFDEHPAQGIGL